MKKNEKKYIENIEKVNNSANKMTAKARERKNKEKSLFRKLCAARHHRFSTWLGIHIRPIVVITGGICFALDVLYYKFPNMWSLIKSPGGETYWDLFGAQVGISMVGLSIVALIISFVKTKAHGMSIPLYVMQIRPWYWGYKFIMYTSIAAIPVNWFLLMFQCYNTAVLVVVLNCVLFMNTVDKAFDVIYAPDEVIGEIRDYIMFTHKKQDMINLYYDIIDNIESDNHRDLAVDIRILHNTITIFINKAEIEEAKEFFEDYQHYVNRMYIAFHFKKDNNSENYISFRDLVLDSYETAEGLNLADDVYILYIVKKWLVDEFIQKNHPSNKSSDDFMRKSVYETLDKNSL
jgi:hypothetical protein